MILVQRTQVPEHRGGYLRKKKRSSGRHPRKGKRKRTPKPKGQRQAPAPGAQPPEAPAPSQTSDSHQQPGHNFRHGCLEAHARRRMPGGACPRFAWPEACPEADARRRMTIRLPLPQQLARMTPQRLCTTFRSPRTCAQHRHEVQNHGGRSKKMTAGNMRMTSVPVFLHHTNSQRPASGRIRQKLLNHVSLLPSSITKHGTEDAAGSTGCRTTCDVRGWPGRAI